MEKSAHVPESPGFQLAARWDRIPDWARWLLCWLLVFAAILLAQYNNLHTPYFWDAIGYVYPHSAEILANNFHPILKGYDVGHPTGFYLLVALAMKLLGGPGPLPGHIVMCGFNALLLLVVFAMGRRFGVPPLWSAALAVLFFLHPLVWSQSQQVLLDLPMTALILWSYLLWSRGRYVPYLIVGGLATWTKLYGFLLVCGPVAALVFTSGRFWCPGNRGRFLREVLWSLSPVLIFLGYLALRVTTRGNWEATVHHVTGNTLRPFWRFSAWMEYVPLAWRTVIGQADLDLLGALLGCLWITWMGARKWGGLAVSRVPLPAAPDARRLALALLFLGLLLNAMFLQMTGVLARYNLPVLAAVFVGIGALLFALTPRAWVLGPLALLAGCIFVLRWSPTHTEGIPEPLRGLIGRHGLHSPAELTNDLRYQEVIEQIDWAVDKVWEDAGERGVVPVLATHWPITVAAGVPGLGYVETGIASRTVSSWREIDPTDSNYVLFVEPIASFAGDPDPERMGVKRLGERIKPSSRAQVWFVWPQ